MKHCPRSHTDQDIAGAEIYMCGDSGLENHYTVLENQCTGLENSVL
jgi:hypothetical protein